MTWLQKRLVSAGVVVTLAILTVRFIAGGMSFQCGRHPARQTFVRYFPDAPEGVSDVRARGHISVGGAEVWMRFRAPKSDLRALTLGYTRLSSADARDRVHYLTEEGGVADAPADRPNLDQEHRLHWMGLRCILRPEVFVNPLQNSGSQSTLVVDRPGELVYFYHWNQ